MREEGMVTRGGEEEILSPRSRLFMSQMGEKEVKKIKRECDKGKFADLVTQVGGGGKSHVRQEWWGDFVQMLRLQESLFSTKWDWEAV